MSKQSVSQRRQSAVGAVSQLLESRRLLDASYWSLASGSLIQDWENRSLITVNDNWSGVPSIEGYFFSRTGSTNTDPQTILGDPPPGSTVSLDVVANQTSGNVTGGGLIEVHLASEIGASGTGTVGIQGSDVADDPFLKLYVDNSGRSEAVRIRYDLIDIDSTAASTANPTRQSFALQYRIGESGDFTNVPEGYVENAADFTSGATGLTTSLDVTLPADTIGAAQVQIRILTTNASGTDQLVAVDNIRVFGSDAAGGSITFDPSSYSVIESVGTANLTLKRIGSTAGAVSVSYSIVAGTASAGSDFIGGSGIIEFADGQAQATIPVTIVDDFAAEPAEQFTVTISNPTGGAALGTATTATVTINDDDPDPPPPPSAPTLDPASDSGRLGDDAVTNSASIIVWTQGVAANAVVSVFRDGQLIAERIGPGEVVDSTAPEGTVSYTVQQTVDGRTSLPSTPLVVTIDRTAPAAPSAPVLQASSDSGFSNADRITNVTTPTFDIASTDSFYRAFVNGVQVGGDYLTGPFTAPVLPEGVHTVSIRAVDAAGNVSEAGTDLTVTIDTTPPTLAQSAFVFEVGHVLEFLFDDLITGAPTSDHLTVTNLTTGAAVPSSLAYLNPRATFSFPQFASGLLREGNYRATLTVPNLTDRAGNVGTASATLDFHVLTADINRNRIVDFADLLAVAQNYGQFGRTFSQGNVDYSGDGFVGFNDLLTLAQSYGRSLLIAPAPEPSSRVGVFSRSKRRIGEELGELMT